MKSHKALSRCGTITHDISNSPLTSFKLSAVHFAYNAYDKQLDLPDLEENEWKVGTEGIEYHEWTSGAIVPLFVIFAFTYCAQVMELMKMGDEVEMNSLIDGIFDDYDHHQLMRVNAQIYANLFVYIHSLILMRNVLLLKIMHNCLFTRIDIYIEMFVLLFCS